MRRVRGLCLPLASLILLLLTSVVHAGVYWESEVLTKDAKGHAEESGIERNYCTADASRVELPNGRVLIIRFDTMTMYRLHPDTKTYSETRLDDLMPAMNHGTQKQLLGLLAHAVEVTPTGETRKISGYKCRKYNISLLTIAGEYWVSKDVQGYGELKEISAGVARKLEKSPLLSQFNIMDIINKADGFPVQATVETMNGQTVTTLKKADQRKVSDNLFRIPDDYTLRR